MKISFMENRFGSGAMRIALFVPVASVLGGNRAQAGHVNTENVLDVRTPWQSNQTATRTFRSYSGVQINDFGDVFVGGNFERTPDGVFRDRPNFNMYSVEGHHDGSPDHWIMQYTTQSTGGLHNTSPVDGKSLYTTFAGVNTNLRGYYIQTAVDFPPNTNSGNTRRLEQYTGLDTASPTVLANGTYRPGLPPTLTFAPGLPNVDATTTNVTPPDTGDPLMTFVNRPGDSIYFTGSASGKSAVYRRNAIGSSATVERVFGYGDHPEITGNFTPVFYTGQDVYGFANSNVLVARNPTNNTFFDLARVGSAVPGLAGYQYSQVTDGNARDATSSGMLVFTPTILNTATNTQHNAVMIANALTGEIKPIIYSGAPFAGIPNTFVSWGGGDHLTADNDDVFYGNLHSGAPNGPEVFSGLLRYDSQTSQLATYISGTASIPGTAFSLTGIDSFGMHHSGNMIAIVTATNGTTSGNGLIVVDSDGNITPVILPGDTVSFANGDLLTVSYIESANLGSTGIDGARISTTGSLSGFAVNEAGQMALILRSASGVTSPGGVFTLQLPVSVPEPASLSLLALGGLALLRRRQA
jgi:hypothetical protein